MRSALQSALVLLFACLIACKGPQGDVGPKGETGSTGQPGIQGVQGPAGQNGTSATAIQIKLDRGLTSDDNGTFSVSSAITPSQVKAVENGVVLQYFLQQGFWYLLPTYMPFGNDFYEYNFIYAVQDGFLRTFAQQRPSTLQSRKKVSVENVRVVIIPASNARINYEDYEAVKSAYNLED